MYGIVMAEDQIRSLFGQGRVEHEILDPESLFVTIDGIA